MLFRSARTWALNRSFTVTLEYIKEIFPNSTLPIHTPLDLPVNQNKALRYGAKLNPTYVKLLND